MMKCTENFNMLANIISVELRHITIYLEVISPRCPRIHVIHCICTSSSSMKERVFWCLPRRDGGSCPKRHQWDDHRRITLAFHSVPAFQYVRLSATCLLASIRFKPSLLTSCRYCSITVYWKY